ncbi:SGNH/GDSL hydrolase family protein [Enterococcus asini]|uniref:SGNH/GDSL hydrolase family protein n=1 Tax=Enterococcus asini TaxID=57732 RepID=UPI00288C9C7B|nr:SGNH/GDSL hydrolase family protein [Enterococcus asini]MDT2756618.1 SGNH/GDSL hydrolase family protein [Enterococcus asini]
MKKLSRKQLFTWLWQALVFFIAVLLVYVSLNQFFPAAQPILEPLATDTKDNQVKHVHYVALGDSLTEGVGDQSKRGGFVPIVAEDIQERYNLSSIEVDNYGVAGDRSDQILKRVQKDEDLQKSLTSADFISVTVGGNDLMKVFQDNFFSLTVKKFNKPQKKYQKRIDTLLTEIRELNPKAPIYLLGIYNPFYLNFPDIEDMQTIVDHWNDATKEIVATFDKAYFIPINDLLYQGLDQKVGVESDFTLDSSEDTETSDTTTSAEIGLNQVDNNVLYEEDKFHPNNIGYQLMANAVRDELIKTQADWLEKD